MTAHIAHTLEEVPMLLAQQGSYILAGGTGSHPNDAEILVDIRELRGLSGIRGKGTKIELGPLTTFAEIGGSMPLRTHAPALVSAALGLSNPETRDRATLGGNLCGSRAGSLALVLLAANAQITLLTEADQREMALERFYAADGSPKLNRGEFLYRVSFPVLGETGREAFRQTGEMRPDGDNAVSVAIRMVLDGDGIIQTIRAFGSTRGETIRLRSLEKRLKGQSADGSLLSVLDADPKLPAVYRQLTADCLQSMIE